MFLIIIVVNVITFINIIIVITIAIILIAFLADWTIFQNVFAFGMCGETSIVRCEETSK